MNVVDFLTQNQDVEIHISHFLLNKIVNASLDYYICYVYLVCGGILFLYLYVLTVITLTNDKYFVSDDLSDGLKRIETSVE